ncbi:hypothetical protein P692DRAFT_201064333 [Suillus brevipes Sb2]|nr:hypothetical protein P692DRAFT_201064333 [Suillus brevipes Sb2]
MKSISLITMIMAVAMLPGIVTATSPNGHPCAQTNKYECGRYAGYNNGHAFLFFCSAQNFVEIIQNCTCVECCTVVNGGVPPNGYFTCT